MAIGAALGLLLLTETGVPVPVPGDLLMLLVGERASAGELSVWIAVLIVELLTIAGTITLFMVARGPARALLTRLGPRIGLTTARIERASTLLERRSALAIGRMTPGARTITVVAAASAPLPWRYTLPALIVGSTIFVQAHVLLGYALGPVARDALERAKGPFVIALAAVVVGGLAFWLVRRGGREGSGSFVEAACPACLVASVISPADRHLHSSSNPRPKEMTNGGRNERSVRSR